MPFERAEFHRPLLLALVAGLTLGQVGRAEEPRLKHRQLPGVRSDGFIQLPNQWSLKPAGRQIEVGNFPVNIALHPTSKWAAVLHAGADVHEIAVIDLAGGEVVSRTTIDQTFYGLAFSPDGKTLCCSGAEFALVHAFGFEEGLLSSHRRLPFAEPRAKSVAGGVAFADNQTLFACDTWGASVQLISLDGKTPPVRMPLKKDDYPYAVLPLGKDRLAVSLWGASAVAVLDGSTGKEVGRWATEAHPTELAASPDGKTLFVACANSTKVSVLDAATGAARETIVCSLYPAAPAGNTPNSLCLSPDGALLFVANADANNLAVFNVSKPGQSVPLGFVPVGWYPTSVRFDPLRRKLLVANGKGTTPKANPQGDQPGAPRNATISQYIARLFLGTVSIIDQPRPGQIQTLTRTAFACSPLKRDSAPSATPPKGHPIPAKVGDPSPIRHCVYIVKENRTYDQVFGDMPTGNGDPSLCLFPERVTPNHHKLAREFVLLDNFYVDGEVSADGHEWTMGAYATDFVEKLWPLKYRGRGKSKNTIPYPAEGSGGPIAVPPAGYFWDRCKQAGLTYRSYGEFIDNAAKVGDPSTTKFPALVGHFDPFFRGFDMNYPDSKRADRFLEELARFEKEGEFPRFVVMRLPNDHTSGTAPNKPTPTAFVADNDLALGRVVEGLSKSRFWKDMAIFVIEDDAQNGPDHVDAHRAVALVASPYCRRGVVDSSMYSTTSMLRTMGLILGTPPLSQFDAAARPMIYSFQAKPDLTPYTHAPAIVDLNEKNSVAAWGGDRKFDLTKEDAADDLAFNEVIWRSVKGSNSPMPAPVRAAFVTPKPKDDD